VIGKLLLGLLASQVGMYAHENVERGQKYAQARQYADSVGKPLLVVGGVWGMGPIRLLLHIPAHGCGDVCLDINPVACKECNTVVADVKDIPFPDLHFGAAIASHVLEHMPTIRDAIAAADELYRVADKVWVISPTKISLMSWMNNDHHLWVKQKGDMLYIEPGPRYKGE